MISVCMATYNGEKYIKEQIDSILHQLGTNDELIISDDGSTDNTCNIVNSYSDTRIRLYHNNNLHGFRYNFENALKHAKGEYIFLSDQDDIWLDDKVEKNVELLHQYDVVVSDAIVTDKDLNILYPSFFSINGCQTSLLGNVLHTSFYGACMAFRKSILQLSIPLCKTKAIGHDQWIGYIGLLTGKVYFCKTPYILYRRLDSSVTNIGNIFTRSHRSVYCKIRDRIMMIYEIIKFLHNRIK